MAIDKCYIPLYIYVLTSAGCDIAYFIEILCISTNSLNQFQITLLLKQYRFKNENVVN
jgi:hypothetical protein